MVVVKLVDQDVSDKVDIPYIESQFADLQNIGILYICTLEGGDEEDWTDETGMRYIVIPLSYKQVKRISDIRPLMLAKAKERLGLVA